MTDYQRFDVEVIGNLSFIRLLNEELISAESSLKLEQELLDFVDSKSPTDILVSFERVRSLSSRVINLLLQVRSVVGKNNGRVKLYDVRPELRRVFRILNLDGNVLEIYDHRVDAVDSF